MANARSRPVRRAASATDRKVRSAHESCSRTRRTTSKATWRAVTTSRGSVLLAAMAPGPPRSSTRCSSYRWNANVWGAQRVAWLACLSRMCDSRPQASEVLGPGHPPTALGLHLDGLDAVLHED